MVSYFVLRGRLLMRAGRLAERQRPSHNFIWNPRQAISAKCWNRRACSASQREVKDTAVVIGETNITKASGGASNVPKYRRDSFWWSWTAYLMRLAPVGFCVFAAIEWRLHKRRCASESLPTTASQFQSKIYRLLPLRLISRCWGWLASCYIPTPFRPLIFGCYTAVFNVNLDEALHSNYKHYASLSEFFTRPLKDDVRPIDTAATLTSPADGRVLHFGAITGSLIEQVKGINYNIESFIGPLTWVDAARLNQSDHQQPHYTEAIKEAHNNTTELYQCVIYLAPGDYHRFHSPTQWQPLLRRHFAGELLSVCPRIAKWMPDLFSLNERAVYIGRWKHGFFSYTAVGATNVGSLQIYMDENLKTNRWMGLNVGTPKGRSQYEELRLEHGIDLQQGELLGQFNMGSSIVLIFEAPKNFKFTIRPGQKIYMGQSLGSPSNEPTS